MRSLPWVCSVFLWVTLAGSAELRAQQVTLHARSNLVLVPTLVEDSQGAPVFNLTENDFLVKDNGVPQRIHLDPDTDRAPMSIVVLVQNGGSAVREFYKMRGLPEMVNALAGDTRHHVAVVTFDSQPHMLLDFSSSANTVQHAIYSIQSGDGGAAILDSVWYAVDMLQDEPTENQRVIVLLSETRDHGSRTPVQNVVEKIGRSNTVVYSLAFSPSRSDFLEFTHPSGESADLVPLVRMAVAALHRNTAEAIPRMTGGEYFRFNNGKQLDNEIGRLANQVHNRYILSFQPTDPHPGLHVLSVELKQPLRARVLARSNYWAISPDASGGEGMPVSGQPSGSPPN